MAFMWHKADLKEQENKNININIYLIKSKVNINTSMLALTINKSTKGFFNSVLNSPVLSVSAQ